MNSYEGLQDVMLPSPNAPVIGRQGEKNVTRLCIHAAELRRRFPSGTFEVVFRRADRALYPLAAEEENGMLYAVLDAQELAVEGVSAVQVRVYQDDVQIYKGKAMSVVVEKSMGAVGTKPNATPNWVDTVIQAAEKMADDAGTWADEAIAKANAAAETADTAAQKADTAREKADSAEVARAKAETARVLAENERVSAEQQRTADTAAAIEAADEATANALTARTAASSAAAAANEAATNINNAEAGRVSAENARVSSETARAAAETDRADAEAERASAETARASAETKRETDTTAAIAVAENATTEANTAAQAAQAAAASITFLTFEVSTDDGHLYVNNPERISGIDFGIDENGYLEVVVNG